MILTSMGQGLWRRLRAAAVVFFVPLHLVCFDLALRLAIVCRSERCVLRVVRGAAHSMNTLLGVLCGMRVRIDPRLSEVLRTTRETIVVANHHSPLDIQVLQYAMSQRTIHFVCREGLERGLPFISRNIRHACAVLRKDARENEATLAGLARRITAQGNVAVIFPEGRKSARNYPALLPFKSRGLDVLTTHAPAAQVITVALRGTHDAWPGPGQLPGQGVVIEVILVDTVPGGSVRGPELARHCEMRIRQALGGAAPPMPQTSPRLWA